MSGDPEALVEAYLSCNGEAFVCPQYQLWAGSVGSTPWSCPDFVALDFKRREVVVVEVSADSSLGNLPSRVRERETRWFTPLRERLLREEAINDAWIIRFLGFVRRELVDKAGSLAGGDDVIFHPLEDVAFAHLYWDERMKGLPGSRQAGDRI